MKIGLFTDTYAPHINGVATSVQILKSALEEKGHIVYIVTVNDSTIKYKEESKKRILKIPGIPLEKLGIYDYRLTGIYPIQAINKIKKWNLDIIHCHTEFGVGTFARIIAKQLKIPIVHTYHTLYEDYVHYVTKGHFNKSSRKLLTELTKIYCSKTIDQLIVPTNKTKEILQKKYNIDRNVHVIPTGIDLKKFYKKNHDEHEIKKIREKYGFKNDDFVILFVGRFGKEKNIEFLINNHCSLLKKDKRFKLLLVGDGPERKTYENLIEKNKIKNNVVFAGKIFGKELTLTYNAADVFSTASKSETQGLTIIEAMAASIVTTAIDDESFKNYIINEKTGLLYSNKSQYVKCMTKLINDKILCENLIENALIKVQEASSETYATNVLKVYEVATKKDSTVRFKDRIRNFFRRKK
ncbi:MAG: glycosyltransferase [Bacilli bacterium]